MTPTGGKCALVYHPDLLRHPDSCPALVLNADYTPLSYYPLSLDLAPDEAYKLRDIVLVPCMPVEAFIAGASFIPSPTIASGA